MYHCILALLPTYGKGTVGCLRTKIHSTCPSNVQLCKPFHNTLEKPVNVLLVSKILGCCWVRLLHVSEPTLCRTCVHLCMFSTLACMIASIYPCNHDKLTWVLYCIIPVFMSAPLLLTYVWFSSWILTKLSVLRHVLPWPVYYVFAVMWHQRQITVFVQTRVHMVCHCGFVLDWCRILFTHTQQNLIGGNNHQKILLNLTYSHPHPIVNSDKLFSSVSG